MVEAAAAIIGIGISAYGLFEQYEGSKKQQKDYDAQSAISQQQYQQSQAAEAARNKQMKIAADRERRKAYQEYLVQASIARARGVASGQSAATNLQSSSYQGAQSQLASQIGGQLGDSFTTEGLGQDIFDANANIAALGATSASYGSDARKQQQGIDIGATLYTVGSAITSGAKTTKENAASIQSSLFE